MPGMYRNACLIVFRNIVFFVFVVVYLCTCVIYWIFCCSMLHNESYLLVMWLKVWTAVYDRIGQVFKPHLAAL